eukprot:TRINITY_DN3142_c0_g1_i1.p1 TRINITY_DN3142_c0_g1~~TRINITY_DN3142_c0_g1_i1.p1  ORF type:complete len:980 (-),score=342.92 TRINITY_DN3142_c0_g1_i1:90-2981(-)
MSEDYDDYEDEEEVVSKRSKKKKTSLSASSFVIDEADEDDDDDEDEFDEYESEGDVGERIDHEPIDRSTHRREDRNRFLEIIDEKEITERYKNYGNEINTNLQDTPEEALRPSKQDSPLWLIKCKPGKEKDCVLQLMQLHFARLELGKPIAILSAIACENISGYVYVEARNRNAVKDAINEITNIFPFQMNLVPHEEMTDVLKSQKQKPLINPGDWVRVSKGLYKGDIAKVLEADDPNKIMVKLIPRIDMEEFDQKDPNSNNNQAKKRKKFNFANRPKAMLMNLKDQSGNKESFDYKGYTFDRNGFLYKPMNYRSLRYNDVSPTLDELQLFNQKSDDFSSEEDDRDDDFGEIKRNREEKKKQINHKNLSLDIQNMKKKKKNFLKGETVIVIAGEYQTMKGKVDTISGDIVIVRLFDFPERPLRFAEEELEKFFQSGDHVKVLEGRHKGETGLIIKVEENFIYILSDENKLNQIVVLKQDIQESNEVSVGKLKLGNYSLHDLVKIQGTRNVGVVIKIETDTFRLLDNTGLIKVLRLPEMGQKMRIKDATSFDKNANQISVDDTIKIEDGKYKGRTGKVVHIFRFYIFLKSSEITENYGWAAIKTDHCTLIGGTKKPINSIQSTLESPSNNLKSPARMNKGKGFRGKRDELLYKNVRIVKGKHKGKLGLVTNCTDTKVQVELQSVCATFTFDRRDIVSVDPIQSTSFNNPQFDGGQTPKQLNTPLIHNTPSHSSAWDPMQPNTPKTYETPGTDYMDDDPQHSPGSYSNIDMIVNTPGYNNFSPGTTSSPRSVDSAKHSSTPSMGIETPPMSLDLNPTTPSTFNLNTPTPNLHMSEYPSNFPAGFDESNNEIEWMEDVFCLINSDRFANGHYKNVEGRIIELNQNSKTLSLQLESGETVRDVPFDAVTLPTPQKNDQLRIVSGDQHVGSTGTLVGMDEHDCIVKLDEGKKQICLIHLQHLRIVKRA